MIIPFFTPNLSVKNDGPRPTSTDALTAKEYCKIHQSEKSYPLYNSSRETEFSCEIQEGTEHVESCETYFSSAKIDPAATAAKIATGR